MRNIKYEISSFERTENYKYISKYIQTYQNISYHNISDKLEYFRIYQIISQYISIFHNISEYIRIYQNISEHIRIYQGRSSVIELLVATDRVLGLSPTKKLVHTK